MSLVALPFRVQSFWRIHAFKKVLVFGFFALHAQFAHAQTTPSEADAASTLPPQVVSPVPRQTGVSYPASGSGDAVVVLRFVVQMDGSVRDVEVLLGDEPFASAAAADAVSWSFAPATRNGKPVAARIDFEVVFQQEQAPLPEQSEVAPTGNDPIAAAGPEAPERKLQSNASAQRQATAEVIIQEELSSGDYTLSRAAARQVPGAFGDPTRAIDLLPGVTPTVSGLPFFYVRGAPPANTGYYFDGVRVPFLYHAFLGPSVIHPELIDAVHLFAGPAPARFGGNAGGVVSADLRAPSSSRTIGASIGVFDVGGVIDTPFADGKGRLFLAGRYSYTAWLTTLFSSIRADFWNYQASIAYDVTKRDRLGVVFMGAYDLAAQDDGIWQSTFHIADVRYDRMFAPTTSMRLAATLEFDKTVVPDGESSDFRLAGRGQLTHRFTDDLKWELGLSGNQDKYDIRIDLAQADPIISELFPARTDRNYGGYTELTWNATPRVRVVPGVRIEQYKTLGDEQLAVEPRITASYRLSDKVQTTYGFGISHQQPNWLPNIAAIRIAGLGDEGLQKAVFTTSGVEVRLPEDWKASGALFHNAIFEVSDPFGQNQSMELARPDRGLGRSYGLELALSRSLTRRFGGMLSYTLSRTTRSYDRLSTVSGADRTHVINLAGLYTLGANWRLGARAVGYSGFPGRMEDKGSPYDQERAPFFFRADVRVERRFRISETSYWSLVAELLNATGSKDVLRRECFNSRLQGKVQCEDTQVGPLMLPNIKVEALF
jgi:hypothetical protein